MANIKHNRFIISVPKDYTEKEVEQIRTSLVEAREKNEDVILSSDIKVYPLSEVIPAKTETTPATSEQTTQQETTDNNNNNNNNTDDNNNDDNNNGGENGKGSTGSDTQE